MKPLLNEIRPMKAIIVEPKKPGIPRLEAVAETDSFRNELH
jgi:hypothetical protein